jgi:uncharacterized protein YlxW (UPF0749 family)
MRYASSPSFHLASILTRPLTPLPLPLAFPFFLQEYQQTHQAYLSAKDTLDTSQKQLLDINAESNNLRQDVATKEMAIGDLTAQVDALRASVAEVEKVQKEQRALFKQDCRKLMAEAM